MATLADWLQPQKPNNWKFLDKLNIKQTNIPYIGKGYAETWHKGDEGSPDWMMRPNDIPLNQNGISVFQPDKWTEKDTAGEGLHLDPLANQYRVKLLESMSPQQMDQAKHDFNDYNFVGDSIPETNKINNLSDAMMRGYTVNQAPDSFNQSFYNTQQKETLNQLKRYMQTGVKPGGTLQDYLRKPNEIR